MKQHLICSVFLAASFSLQADTLELRDGRTLDGDFIGGTSRNIRFVVNGRTEEFPVTEVRSVSFGRYAPNSPGSSRLGGSADRYGNQAGVAGGVRDDSYNNSDDRLRRSRNSGNQDWRGTIPAGTVVTVRMIDEIDSDANSAGQTFRASLDDPIVINGQTVVPAGADATVQVARVEQAGRVSGREEIVLELADVSVNGRRVPMQTNPAEVAAKSKGRQTAEVVGGTAVVGAIIGAIAGGGKGAAIGAATGAGAGAAVQAIRGNRVKVAPEARLDFTLTQPVNMR